MKKPPEGPCTPFNPRNDQRLISNEAQREFKVNQSLNEFNEAFERTDWVEPIDLPDFRPRKQYLQSLYLFQSYLQEEKKKKIEAAIAEVNSEYVDKEKFYEMQIKKLEAIMLLEEQFDFEVRQKDRET
jgi:hypothetical protein